MSKLFALALIGALSTGAGFAATTITTSSLPPATVGQNYSFQLSATGGAAPYTWEVSGLPANLQANSAGLITGIPQQAGNYLVGAIARDSQQVGAAREWVLVVGVGPLKITTTALPSPEALRSKVAATPTCSRPSGGGASAPARARARKA